MKLDFLQTLTKSAMSEFLRHWLPAVTTTIISQTEALISFFVAHDRTSITVLLILTGLTLSIILKLFSLNRSQKKLTALIQDELKELKEKMEKSDYEKDYDLDGRTGLSKSKATGQLVCTSCAVNHQKSPVLQSAEGWTCLNDNCKKFYQDPDRKLSLPFSKKISRPDNLLDKYYP